MVQKRSGNQRKNKKQEFEAGNDDFNVVDLILFDHEWMKDCIEILKDEDGDEGEKADSAKILLEGLKKHSEAEKKAVYSPLREVEEFHDKILEAEVEHGIVDQKVKMLTPKVKRVRALKEELAAEMKVLAELVEHHVEEEESEFLPKMREEIDEDILNFMGFEFLKLRQFSESELMDKPELQESASEWKSKSHANVSSGFKARMSELVDQLSH